MKNQNGFTLLEGLIVVLILVIVGFGGYYVWSQNEDDETEQTNTSQKETDANNEPMNDTSGDEAVVSGETKTVTFGGYTYIYDLPDGWDVEEQDASEYGEYNVYISDPNNKYRMNLKTANVNNSNNSPNQTKLVYDTSFIGVNKKTNYIKNINNSTPGTEQILPALHISACEEYFCHNEFGPDKEDSIFLWFLGIYIERSENINSSIADANNNPIDVEESTVQQMLDIVGTIETQ